jgi:3-oxochol-4-en-24-oyl-CoA dehydrogenase
MQTLGPKPTKCIFVSAMQSSLDLSTLHQRVRGSVRNLDGALKKIRTFDQRIAPLAVGGQDPGARSSVRKLIGVRYRQALAEFRMDLTDGAGVVEDVTVHDFLNTRCLTGTEQILLTLVVERLLGLLR